MPDQSKFHAFWESLTVEQRRAHVENRELSPAMKEMAQNFEKRRQKGFNRPRVDLVPSFVQSFVAMRSLSQQGDNESRAEARAAMFNVRKSAQQQLRKKDFQRFMEGIK